MLYFNKIRRWVSFYLLNRFLLTDIKKNELRYLLMSSNYEVIHQKRSSSDSFARLRSGLKKKEKRKRYSRV